MFAKLAAARESGKKKKELTMLGFLVGSPKEFSRIFAKIRTDWKPIKGTLNFTVLKAGWFEISFSNHIDFNLIWENRPYHLFSHLLLLKVWYPGFDPSTESISQLDLWVRLHYLPEEFANSEALETIIEGNLVGEFLKMVPTHNSERWNMFTRFCINTDVESNFGNNVIVPDEHFNHIKYPLWLDDFSPGCGACGKLDQIYKDCHNKNLPIPTLQITIKKPSSKLFLGAEPSIVQSEQMGWNTVGKNKKVLASSSTSTMPSNNIYLSEKGGINVTYESEESEEFINQIFMENECIIETPSLVAVAEGVLPNIYPEQIGMDGIVIDTDGNTLFANLNGHQANPLLNQMYQEEYNQEKEVTEASSEAISLPIRIVEGEKQPINPNTQDSSLLPKADKEELKQELTPKNSGNEELACVKRTDQEQEEYYEEEGDGRFGYEYEIDDQQDQCEYFQSFPPFDDALMSPIINSELPPCTDQDIDDFINYEQADQQEIYLASGNSYHSVQNTIFSSSSVVLKLGNMDVNQMELSNSNFSKRKHHEGTNDMASSDPMSGKKPN